MTTVENNVNNVNDDQLTPMDIDLNETRSDANRYKLYLNRQSVMVPFVDQDEVEEWQYDYAESETASSNGDSDEDQDQDEDQDEEEEWQYDEPENSDHSKPINEIPMRFKTTNTSGEQEYQSYADAEGRVHIKMRHSRKVFVQIRKDETVEWSAPFLTKGCRSYYLRWSVC